MVSVPGGFIKYQNGRVLEQRSCNRNSLFLTTRYSNSTLTEHCLVACRKLSDETVGICQPRGLKDLYKNTETVTETHRDNHRDTETITETHRDSQRHIQQTDTVNVHCSISRYSTLSYQPRQLKATLITFCLISQDS